MKSRTPNTTWVSASAALVAVLCCAGCAGEVELVEVNVLDDDLRIEAILSTCNANLDVDLSESRTTVKITAKNNDRAIFSTGGDDCQDVATFELDEPLGERAVVDGDGDEVKVNRP